MHIHYEYDPLIWDSHLEQYPRNINKHTIHALLLWDAGGGFWLEARLIGGIKRTWDLGLLWWDWISVEISIARLDSFEIRVMLRVSMKTSGMRIINSSFPLEYSRALRTWFFSSWKCLFPPHLLFLRYFLKLLLSHPFVNQIQGHIYSNSKKYMNSKSHSSPLPTSIQFYREKS